MIYAEQDLAVLNWASDILKVKFDYKQCAWIANLSDDCDILGAVVYTRFSPWNCEMSVASASPKWATRKFLKVAFGYPFEQMELKRVTAAVEPDNINSIDMLERLGFVQEATLSEWFGDKDALIYRMKRKDCKWLNTRLMA